MAVHMENDQVPGAGEDLRKEIDRLIAADAPAEAERCLARLWHREAGPSAAGFVVPRYERLQASLRLISARLFILRSFTVEPVVPLLRAAAFANGIQLHSEVGDFNAYAQEMLDPTSRLYHFAPDVVILAVQTRDVAPELWDKYPDLSVSEVREAMDRVIGHFRNSIEAFRSHSKAHLIMHTLEVPAHPCEEVMENQVQGGQSAVIQEINQALRRIAGEQSGVYILDYDALVARHGRLPWHDERKWLTLRLPIASPYLMTMAGEWLRFLHPVLGRVCKVLVTDLDNTLWGGVIGENGLEGIQVGTEYPGASYRALQRVMLDLYRRGIILAICSKNNVADAMEVLEQHPGMLLRPEHFAALRINWDDKAQNLRDIAAELNVGRDSLAFLDDNPVERARINDELPEVTVIDLPSDPSWFAQALRAVPVFERLAISSEDRERGRYYGEQRQRVESQRNATSLEDFLRSLQQEVEVAPVTAEMLIRVAQLTQKTNQFNLTTRRYSEQQIAELAAASHWSVYSIRVKDRFGDNGIVGVMITHDAGKVCEIDTFLLSCRVIGRTIETALLSILVERARAHGMEQLQGWFLPTKKNAPAQGFYATHNFQCVTQEERGTLWSLDLKEAKSVCPDWIRLRSWNGVVV